MTSKQWLIATILTFITICAWVGFDILHARAQVEIPSNVLKTIEPLDPNFNISTFGSKP